MTSHECFVNAHRAAGVSWPPGSIFQIKKGLRIFTPPNHFFSIFRGGHEDNRLLMYLGFIDAPAGSSRQKAHMWLHGAVALAINPNLVVMNCNPA